MLESDDLLIEILSRIPVESLLRFRSVSKQWFSVISSSDFIRIYSLRTANQTPPKILIRNRILIRPGKDYFNCEDYYTVHPEDQLPLSPDHDDAYNGITPVRFPFHYFTLVGSCNGFFCLSKYNGYQNIIVLFNPSIRRTLILPSIPPEIFRYCDYSHSLGLGYDSSNDDYKVVRLSHSGRRSIVYTIKTGAWRMIVSQAPTVCGIKSSERSLNGALHWLGLGGYGWLQGKDGPRCSCLIIKFDLSNEVFSIVSLPECLQGVNNDQWRSMELTVIRESLAVVCCGKIWVMREYDNDDSWTVAYPLENLGDFLRVLNLATRKQ